MTDRRYMWRFNRYARTKVAHIAQPGSPSWCGGVFAPNIIDDGTHQGARDCKSCRRMVPEGIVTCADRARREQTEGRNKQ